MRAGFHPASKPRGDCSGGLRSFIHARALSLLFVSQFLFFALSADASITNSAWAMRVWRTDEGLPNNKVSSLAQTLDGYLWVATESSLARFDGFRFEEFSSVMELAGRHQRVTTLQVGLDGGLWLALERGAIIH